VKVGNVASAEERDSYGVTSSAASSHLLTSQLVDCVHHGCYMTLILNDFMLFVAYEVELDGAYRPGNTEAPQDRPQAKLSVHENPCRRVL